MKIIKKLGGGVLLAVGIVFFAINSSVAALVDTPWGPNRETFTWADPAPYAVFNSITDNPSIGDERNFVRVKESTSNTYVDEITLEANKIYDIYIYYHNNADAHEVGKTAVGIADGVTMTSNFPSKIKAGERLTANATISALDTEPLAVWDGVYLDAEKDLTLSYVPGSALIYNGGNLNGQSIGPDYLFGDGALLGYNEFSGMLPGCNEYAGYVTYQIATSGKDNPVTPVNPDTPSEIPETGPAEIALASVVIIAIVAGGAYWYKTNKAVKKVTRRVTASRKTTKRRK